MTTNNVSSSNFKSLGWTTGVRAAVCSVAGGAGGAARLAAQAALKRGWPVLLPTATERARLLSSLLPQGAEAGCVSPGKQFLRELLVGALLAGGGLRSAIRRLLRPPPSSVCDTETNL